jgi:hypothetical protein
MADTVFGPHDYYALPESLITSPSFYSDLTNC